MSSQSYAIFTYDDAATGTAFLEAVGFRRVALHHEDEDRQVVAHGEYAWRATGGLMLGSARRGSDHAEDDQVGRGRIYCVLDRDAEVDETYRRALDAGGRSLAAPADQDYGARSCTVADPEGNVLGFGSYAGAHGPAALRPKLVVADADAAIAFYGNAFGAQVQARHAIDGSVVFAQLRLGDLGVEVQVKDADDADPVAAGAPGVLLELTVGDPDAVWERAVDAGATVRFPLTDQPYGARQGRLIDPFGQQWLVSGPLTMSPEQIDAALAEMS